MMHAVTALAMVTGFKLISGFGLPLEARWLCLGSMQIQASSFTGIHPPCPVDPDHTIHGHGSYERYANCDDNTLEAILRFLCVPCGHTISVLPDHRLPYRAVPAPFREHQSFRVIR